MNKHEYCIYVRGTIDGVAVAKLFVLDGTETEYVPVTEGTVSIGTGGKNACEAIGSMIGLHSHVDVFRGYAGLLRKEDYEGLGCQVSEIGEDTRLFGINVDLSQNWEEEVRAIA